MKLAMVGIIVNEMEKAIKFYECLGFSVDHFSEEYTELRSDTIRISLNKQSMVEEVYGFIPSLTGERIELAFELHSRTALNQLWKKITQQGYKGIKEPWEAQWGQYYAIISDVDGNLLSLFVDNQEEESGD